MGTLVYRQLRFSELSRLFIDSGLTTAILPFMLVEIVVLFLVSFFPETILIVPRIFGYA